VIRQSVFEAQGEAAPDIGGSEPETEEAEGSEPEGTDA
jgi:hypothetical protein